MRCPNCGSINTCVVDSRPNEEETRTRRRHKCNECDCRFTTYEIYKEHYGDLVEKYAIDLVKAKHILQEIIKIISREDT